MVSYNFLDRLEEIAQEMKVAMQANDPQAVAVRVVSLTKMIAQARDEMAGQDRLDRLIGQRQNLVRQQDHMIRQNERQMAIGAVVSLLLRTFSSVIDVVEQHADPGAFRVIMDQSRLAIQSSMIYLGAEDMILEGESQEQDTENQNGR